MGEHLILGQGWTEPQRRSVWSFPIHFGKGVRPKRERAEMWKWKRWKAVASREGMFLSLGHEDAVRVWVISTGFTWDLPGQCCLSSCWWPWLVLQGLLGLWIPILFTSGCPVFRLCVHIFIHSSALCQAPGWVTGRQWWLRSSPLLSGVPSSVIHKSLKCYFWQILALSQPISLSGKWPLRSLCSNPKSVPFWFCDLEQVTTG